MVAGGIGTAAALGLGAGDTTVTLRQVWAMPLRAGGQRVKVTPDGTTAVVMHTYVAGMSVIDLAARRVVRSLSNSVEQVNDGDLVVGPDGRRAFITAANRISVLDLRTYAVTPAVVAGDVVGGTLAVAPDGSRVYATRNGAGSLAVLDGTGSAVLATVEVGRGPVGVTTTPDGRSVWVANATDATVSEIDAASLAVRNTIQVVGNPTAVAVTDAPLRVHVLSSRSANSPAAALSVIDPALPAVIAVTPYDVVERPDGLVAGAGGLAFVANYVRNSVTAVRLVTGRAQATLDLAHAPRALDVVAGGRQLVTVGDDPPELAVVEVTED